MASHSEIALVDPTKLGATRAPKSATKRARIAQSNKAEKRSAARKKSKKVSKSQPNGTDIVPVMKLRAVDILDDSGVTASQETKTQEHDTAPESGDASRIIQMPALANTTPGASQEGIGPDTPFGIDVPTGEDGEPLVTDPELLELLEQLSTTIDTATTALDAASGAPALEATDSNPKPEPAPQPEAEEDDPPPLAAEFAVPSSSEQTSEPRPWGFGLVVNAAIAGLILAAGMAWLTYTNPWLLESKPATPPELEQVASAPPARDLTEAAPAEQVQTSIAAAPVADPAPFAPPDDDPVPMEAATPPAPEQAAASSGQIRVAAGQSVPLTIALPPTSDQTEISVMVQDVPKLAKLSAGKNLGAGNWLLDEGQLDKLTLTTTEGLAPGTYELEVFFVRSDGKVPETRKVSLIVQPAASQASASASVIRLAPDTAGSESASTGITIVKTGVAIEVPAATPQPAAPELAAPLPEQQASVVETPKLSALTESEIKTILARGGALLSEGDIAGARLLLQYAAERGSKNAMVKLGESYDPKYLAKLGAQGVQADSDQAALWYKRASAAQ